MWDSCPKPIDVARYPSMVLSGWQIRLLAKGLDRSDPDRKLCPVRVLWYYLKRNKLLCDGNKAFFIPLRKSASKGKLSPNTTSGWLKQCIGLAYEVAGKNEALGRLNSVRTHEV